VSSIRFATSRGVNTSRPLHDRKVSDSMPETAAGCGHGAA
jgi:hypothetical protein